MFRSLFSKNRTLFARGDKMQPDLLKKLQAITPEEQAILDGNHDIQPNLYTAVPRTSGLTIDSERLLQKGCLIDVRPHTRFVHFPKHRHNYVEVVYMCSGSTTHIINDTERIVLQQGDLLFLNQNVLQEILPAGKDDIAVNFIILPEFFNKTLSMIEQENVLRDFLISTLSSNSAYYLHISAKDILPVQNLLDNMIWTLFQKKAKTNVINQTTMGLVFMNLSEFADTINKSQPDQYEQNMVFTILKYIETNYRDGTLLEISQQLQRPPYYISRLLKKHTNKNFKELLQERKLQQASYLLLQTPLTIENILDVIGYDNSSYFYHRFKEKYGCSPKKYRSKAT